MRLSILLLLFLTACNSVPSKFDSTLYGQLVNLSVDVNDSLPLCGNTFTETNASALKREADFLLKYSEYTSKDTHNSLSILNKNITEMDTMYKAGKPSAEYCTLKLKIVDAELQELLKGLGGKFS